MALSWYLQYWTKGRQQYCQARCLGRETECARSEELEGFGSLGVPRQCWLQHLLGKLDHVDVK